MIVTERESNPKGKFQRTLFFVFDPSLSVLRHSADLDRDADRGKKFERPDKSEVRAKKYQGFVIKKLWMIIFGNHEKKIRPALA